MRFVATSIADVWIVQLEPACDDRGFFARTFCAAEFAQRGLESRLAQCSLSYNRHKGTLRGLHYQPPPKSEAKLVRCERGALFDVAVDLRRHSPTFGKWLGVELTAENHQALYIPHGCAHGFQTLIDDTGVSYSISEFYDPSLTRGIRWNDPALGIEWPLAFSPILSDRDRDLPTLRDVMEQAGDLRA
jgi:dTDP-4-dehydrorhamnose 3,5-epimerase